MILRMIARIVLVLSLCRCIASYTATCSSSELNDIRLYNTHTSVVEDGAVQVCYSGTWYSVCTSGWYCNEANAACKQLGYAGAVSAESGATFGSWGYKWSYYYRCSGYSSSLTYGCSKHHHSHCYSGNHGTAGVRCYNAAPPETCSHNGAVHLMGGISSNDGALQYCYNGKWSMFCALSTEEASVACKQLGYTKYFRILSSSEYTWSNGNGVAAVVNMTCSGNENSLNDCDQSTVTTSSTVCASITATCNTPEAIKCYNSDGCSDGEVRLVNGSISQEGRVEMCVDGVWGSVCGDGWSKGAAFVVCKQMGYVYSEPVIYTNSKFDSATLLPPILYSNIQCHGWEQSITECTKTGYLDFTCFTTAGLLCPDNCNEGEIRLVGGDNILEGTVEVCFNSMWGLIGDAGWDISDARVMCRQLQLPFDGAYPVYDSHYGKPDRTVHYTYVLCDGSEESVSSCKKVAHNLDEGRKIYREALVAGVVCEHATPTTAPPPCLSLPVDNTIECIEGELQLDSEDGPLEYCVEGHWSTLCTLSHNETTVACRQLGYTSFTWGLPYDIESDGASSTPDTSVIANITCTSHEQKLSECVVNQQTECLHYCSSLLGLRCYNPEDCNEGSVRLVDGIISQEGRVEVCVNGVWGSVCDDGWDKTDAHVVCRQLGYATLEPLAFSGAQFGVAEGPIVYSNVDCGGWESDIQECMKSNHLQIQCSHSAVAGVMCSDDCSEGEVRLLDEGSYGTVEVCYNHLWGLVSEEGWNIRDATVVCRQLGYSGIATAAPIGSLFGRPNMIVHMGSVKCEGSEVAITDCPATYYSIEEGRRNTADNVNVAGVVCNHTTSTIVTTSTSISTTTPCSTNVASQSPPVANSVSDSHDTMVLMVIMILLVCLLILVIGVVSSVYFFCKMQRRVRKKHNHSPAGVTFTKRLVRSNLYDSVTSSDDELDTAALVKNKEKRDDIDITFKPSDEEDDPVYEECSTIKKL